MAADPGAGQVRVHLEQPGLHIVLCDASDCEGGGIGHQAYLPEGWVVHCLGDDDDVVVEQGEIVDSFQSLLLG